MDINSMTIGEFKELAKLFQPQQSTKTLDAYCIGQTVIIRTCSAGVWFGTLAEKSGSEVILKNARRMWQWHCKESISLSGVVVHGIDQDKSRIAPQVGSVWLEAIEILPISGDASASIEGAKDAEAR